MAAAKNSVFIGLYLENYCLVVGGQYGEICLGWEGMRKFLAGVWGGGTLPHSLQWEKSCIYRVFPTYIKIYILHLVYNLLHFEDVKIHKHCLY